MTTQFRGGIRYGNSYPDATFAMWPLAQLQIEETSLQLVLPWRRFSFPRKFVTRLIKYSGHIAVGVQIEHTVLEQPNLIIFWTYHFGLVKSALEKNGYTFEARR